MLYFPLYIALFAAIGLFVLSFYRDLSNRTLITSVIGVLVIYIVAVGFRSPEYGFDALRYNRLFYALIDQSFEYSQMLPWSSVKFLLWNGDAGFNSIAWFVGRFSADARVYNFAIAGIMGFVIGLGIFIRKGYNAREQVFSLLFVLFQYGMLLQFGNTLRQGLAVSAAFLAHSLFNRGKLAILGGFIVLWLGAYCHSLTIGIYILLFSAAVIIKSINFSKQFLGWGLGFAGLIGILLVPFVNILPESSPIMQKIASYATFGFDIEIYVRLSVVVVIFFALYKPESRGMDQSFLLVLTVVLMLCINMHEMAKRILPLATLSIPFYMQRLWKNRFQADRILLLSGITFSVVAMLILLLPPVLNNYAL